MATERPTGCQSPAPALSQVNRHLLVNPARCQLQMAPMTPFDTIIWPIFPKGNRPMSRPQQFPCALSLLTAAANMGAQWLPSQPRGPLAANPHRRPCHKGPKLAPGALRVCYAHVQGLELGEEKLPKPSGRASTSLVLSPC